MTQNSTYLPSARTISGDDLRLFEAAPDMLAALREVTRCLEWHNERHGVAMDNKACEDARAAIARATEG